MRPRPTTPSVLAVARAGAGTNNIPVAALSQRGIPVFNAPGANANAVKELVLAGMLIAARHIAPALRFTAALDTAAPDLEQRIEDGKKAFAGYELAGRTLGVVGLGKVGALVAEAAIKLGMQVLGHDPEITVDAAWSLPSQVKRAGSVDEVLKNADFVSLHVPLLAATRGLVGAANLPLLRDGAVLLNFSRDGVVDHAALVAATRDLADDRRLVLMRPGAVLLNFSRDGVVDAAAAVRALDAGPLSHYVCDFPGPAIHGHPRVVALPHLGASTREAEENCAVMVIDQLRDYLEEGQVSNAVNFPTVQMARESPWRVAIANANVPNILGQMSTTMAQAGLNIHNMVNKSRGEMAYTLVDVDSPVAEGVLVSLRSIAGVLAVRYLPDGA